MQHEVIYTLRPKVDRQWVMLQLAGIVVELAPNTTSRLGNALDGRALKALCFRAARLEQLFDARGNLCLLYTSDAADE